MPDEAPRRWRVVEQRWTTEVTPAGRFQDVVEITIETVSGVTFPLRVPEAAYSPENVAALAEAQTIAVEAVQDL